MQTQLNGDRPDGGLDPVAASVAAYSDHLATYTADSAVLVEAQFERFAADLTVDDIVLDAGCGPGRDLLRFANIGQCVIGVDLNSDFVEAARAAADGWPVKVLHGDLRNLPLTDEHVGAVWACASLVHLNIDDARAALCELARVAKPTSPLYLSVKGPGATGWTDTAHGRRWFQHWDKDRLAAATTAAGFDVTDIETSGAFLDLWATRSL